MNGLGGLSSAAAQALLARHGPNVIRRVGERPVWQLLASQMTHLMALLLWVAGGIAFLAGMPQLGVAIWAVNLLNGAFGFWQEFEARRTVQALRAVLPELATVVRDGAVARIPASQLVPGDLLIVQAGDRISADGVLVEAHDLRVSQAALTGESEPVLKSALAAIRGAEGQAAGGRGPESPARIFAGTLAEQGVGRAIVVATGMSTELGRIARLAQVAGERPSPLQLELARVSRQVALLAVGIGALLFAGALLVVKVPVEQGFVFALGMIVAFVPEGLLPTTTLALAIAVRRMAGRNAVVKRLSSIEALGCATVICADKTGTLTENRMTVLRLWAGGQTFHLAGPGQAASEVGASGDAAAVLIAGALCNDARLVPSPVPGAAWQPVGDATELALLAAAHAAGLDPESLRDRTPRIGEFPFDPVRKRMTTVHRTDGAWAAMVKGAPSSVLPLCRRIRRGGEDLPLGEAEGRDVTALVDAWAAQGLRVLGIATRPLAELPAEPSSAAVEQDLTFLGIVAMWDPPREGVADAIGRCHQAGIRVVMLTGDHPLTAAGIARNLGITRGESPRILTPDELSQLDDGALQEMLASEVVFARSTPEGKLRVVKALQSLGHVVAVTGDGVNDAPALRQADIGVAMGRSGTDVAREAADMVLLDDHFATIVGAVEEGRAVFENIRRFSIYVFTSNVAEAAPFVVTLFSRGRVPLALQLMQVLTIDLGTDVAPAVGLGAEPPELGVMNRPPRPAKEPLLTRRVLALALLWYGLIETLAGLAGYLFVNWSHGWPTLPLVAPGTAAYRVATTATLASIVSCQIGVVLGCRTRSASLLSAGPFGNVMVLGGIAAEIAILLALVYIPVLQPVFHTAALGWREWAFVAIWGPGVLLLDELRKAGARHRAPAENRAGR